MKKTNASAGSVPGRSRRRLGGAAAAVALIATGAVSVIGANTFANDEDIPPPAPPGQEAPAQPAGSEVLEDGELVLGSDALITTASSTFDETILTKFIPAHSFSPLQGDVFEADVIGQDSSVCIQSDAAGGGDIVELFAGVELPDGARIKRISFYGHDSDAALDITTRLHRVEVFTPFVVSPFVASSTRTTSLIDQFSTSGDQSEATVVFGADDLEELTGTPIAAGPVALAGARNRFHTVEVEMRNVATDHVLCGVRVDYQVAAPANPGTVFHPIDPARVFDSRLDVLAESGRLGPNESKVIDITDGYDSAGVAIPSQDNVVPTTATAVAYNITIAGADGSNFVAVTAGDAASFTASAINYAAGSNVANGSTVTIAGDQTIKLWGGNGTGSSHVLIDLVGYYAPAVPSNMAN